jgi:hypothetical protein
VILLGQGPYLPPQPRIPSLLQFPTSLPPTSETPIPICLTPVCIRARIRVHMWFAFVFPFCSRSCSHSVRVHVPILFAFVFPFCSRSCSHSVHVRIPVLFMFMFPFCLRLYLHFCFHLHLYSHTSIPVDSFLLWHFNSLGCLFTSPGGQAEGFSSFSLSSDTSTRNLQYYSPQSTAYPSLMFAFRSTSSFKSHDPGVCLIIPDSRPLKTG